MPMMKGRHLTAAALLIIVVGVALFVVREPGVESRGSSADRAAPSAQRQASTGFRTAQLLQEHYQKHGQEFGGISRDEYLREAQALRDAPLSDSVLEIRRADGVMSRFDKATGSFIAFNADGTIRTFFKPNDGERYFRRQATKEH